MNRCPICLLLLILFSKLGIELKVSYMLGKYSSTKLHLQSSSLSLSFFKKE